MQFPFETTTKDGRKATVLGAMPNGRLAGYIERVYGFAPWGWNADGSSTYARNSITLPLQIKPLTTYRMRSGRIAWTSGLVRDGWIHGLTDDQIYRMWRANDGRWRIDDDDLLDLIAELPPGTTE